MAVSGEVVQLCQAGGFPSFVAWSHVYSGGYAMATEGLHILSCPNRQLPRTAVYVESAVD